MPIQFDLHIFQLYNNCFDDTMCHVHIVRYTCRCHTVTRQPCDNATSQGCTVHTNYTYEYKREVCAVCDAREDEREDD